MADLIKVCLHRRPGLRSMPGFVLTHGMCRRAELEACEEGSIIRYHERFELFLRRHWLKIVFVVAVVVYIGERHGK